MTRVVAEVGSSANQYQVLAKLAAGGMAEIFLAKVASGAGLERHVVLKRILRERAHDAAFVQMFLEEARLAAQLNHPNVAQVYDVGQLGASYFFTMEYVHGETVRALVKRSRAVDRSLPLGIVLTILTGAAAGLHHAHGRIGLDGRPLGIVHRDVSPSNLMVSYEGNVKVVDFGVAKAENRATETRSGTVKGKISYLSPEQCRSVGLDRRSDLFSLGIVMWEMLTGERLYRRGSDFETMAAIVGEVPLPPSRWRGDLPPELDALVLQLLAKEPHHRFQSADDVIHAAEQVAARYQIPLSTSALSRFMRELFGERREPWLEVEAPAPMEQGEGGTISGSALMIAEPEASNPIASAIEQQLARVRVITSHYPAVSESHSQSDAMPARARAGTYAGAPVVPHGSVVAHVSASPAGAAVTATWPDGSTGSASGLASPYPMQRRDAEMAPPEAARSRWPLVLVIGGASLAGVVIAAVMATPGTAPRDAAATEDVAVVEAARDAAMAEPPVDAELVAVAVVLDAPAAVVLDAPAAVVVDAPAAVVVDASPEVAARSPLDPGAPLDAAPVDAAEADVEAAFARGDTATALTRCRGLKPRPPVCVLVACGERSVSLARTWSARLPASVRAEVAAACKSKGIDLTAPAGTRVIKRPDCVANPLDCQY